MRVVSLLPSATEVVCALGRKNALVGRTHECDYPPDVADVPILTRTLLPPEAPSREIDALVVRTLHEHRSLYALDLPALEAARPDVILTQELCPVCAVGYDEVREAARVACPASTTIVSLEPRTLDEVLGQLTTVGEVLGVPERAERVLELRRARLLALRTHVARHLSRTGQSRPRVLVLEWLDPPFLAGHWVPEMVDAAGGQIVGGEPGGESVRVPWDTVVDARSDVLVLAPCGYDVDRTVAEAQSLPARPGWDDIPAVRQGHVWAVDASSYFSRSGPRIVEGVEILARILSPESVYGPPAPEQARRLSA